MDAYNGLYTHPSLEMHETVDDAGGSSPEGQYEGCPVTSPTEAALPNVHRVPDPSRYLSVSAITVWARDNQTENKQAMVARVSIFNYDGRLVLDTFVHPRTLIQDYRASMTGLNYTLLCSGLKFPEVQQRVSAIIKDKIIVGHKIWLFLSALELSHPISDTRDMALYNPLTLRSENKQDFMVELDVLVEDVLGIEKRQGVEDSAERCRNSMKLFRVYVNEFEEDIRIGDWPCKTAPAKYAACYI